MLIQTLRTEPPIQAFHERVLSRLAGLNERQLDATVLAPEEHCFAGEFRAVIADDVVWRATLFNEPGQEASDLVPGY